MAGIYETLKQGNDEKFARQVALAKTPSQMAGVMARGAVDDVGALVAAPMIGVAGFAGDMYKAAKNLGSGFVGLEPEQPAAPTATTPAAPAAAPAAPPKVVSPEGPYPMSLPSNTPIGTSAPTEPATPAAETGVRAVALPAGTNFGGKDLGGQKLFTNVAGNDAAVAGLSAANAPQGAAQVNSMPAPKVTPVAAGPTPQFAALQQGLMQQYNDARQVVAEGSNRDGYKMGDVTKSLATMQNLGSIINSTNQMTSSMYGADAGMLNHAADNAARVGIANASNATELTKSDIAGQYALQGHKITADGAITLASHKAGLEKTTPEGQLASIKAQREALGLSDDLGVSAEYRRANKFAPSYAEVKDVAGNVVGVRRNASIVPLTQEDRDALTPPKRK
jgi:hypothetical protein